MLVSSNVTMQFGSKPLFENISVKFGGGNRYGLIGANGSGKSTFMKILGGDLEPTLGNVSLDPNERIGKLRQDQFAFEEFTVLDTVIMGHKELWEVKQERDRIYALPEMSEEDGYKVADLEVKYGEMDGYSAEARAGELLLGVGIPVEQHYGPMSEVAPGWKLRVLLAQALFADPDILLLDEPTNNLDIDTIRWLEQVLNERDSTMIIISHDRHFLNMVCTHMADLDYGELRVYPGNSDEYMTAATQARERLRADNAKKKAQIAELQSFVSRFSANASKSRQATSRARQIDKIKLELRHQTKHITDIAIIHSRKSLIQRNQPRCVRTSSFIFGHHGRKQGHIHGHCLLTAAECSEHTVGQLLYPLSALLEKELEFKPFPVIQRFFHHLIKGNHPSAVSGMTSGLFHL